MNVTVSLSLKSLEKIKRWLESVAWYRVVLFGTILMSILGTVYAYSHDVIVAYGDAESHLNIAKRVVSGLTAGFAQLGGIWLPIPHLFMVPFVYFDPLWRTGLAGSIVSGAAYVVTSLTLYKLTTLITKSRFAAIATVIIFAANPNILYMQATPMTEMPLIAFMMLSSYFFVKYLRRDNDYLSLILAALFGFCATLSRYDGWFLVLFEAMIIFIKDVFHRQLWKKLEGRLILFCTLAFFGIGLWFLWDFMILGDPLYFTHSQFSANSQQHSWLARGQLPAYHNLGIALLYYAVDTMSNVGIITFFMAVVGGFIFLRSHTGKNKWYLGLLLMVPFTFNIVALFIGQSVIFIPDITPISYEWRLFNVRYGTLMVPILAFFIGYLFYKAPTKGKVLLASLFVFQLLLFGIGYSRVITLDDGTVGLSASKHPDAERWINKHYDKGLVLLDDYARTMSVVKSGIPMQEVIYVGTKPYWEQSLRHPQTYATWIIMQQNDDVWKHLYANPAVRGELFKYFKKVYTSPEILIFKRS